MRNVLNATQELETVTSCHMEALVNVRGEGTSSGRNGCSFKEFYEHPFPMFKGNLNSREAREWLMKLEERLWVVDCTKKQRVNYIAYKFSKEARRWWYAKRNLLVMELESKKVIKWTWFKEECYWEYSWSLRKRIPQELRFNKTRVVGAIGVASCILGNTYQERICATNVARWDTSFKTAIEPKIMVLVYLEGNDGRTRDKHNH